MSVIAGTARSMGITVAE
ncbi:MAG: hypothetical protein MR562_04760 [Clostridiaceae bacterium]|nr:hypothetical protein [Clostridiaceae bacterium]